MSLKILLSVMPELARHFAALFCSVVLFVHSAQAFEAKPKLEKAKVSASLVAENTSIQPATPFRVALRLKIIPDWHTYWQNPGDSGLATRIDWELPDGFVAGAIQWPLPERISTPPLVSFGYSGEVWHIVELTPPANLTPGSEVTLRGNASWLVCKEICLPESAQVSLTLPVTSGPAEPDAVTAPKFAAVTAKLPRVADGWRFAAFHHRNAITFSAKPPASQAGDAGYFFFPHAENTFDYGASQVWREDGGTWQVDLALADTIDTPPQRLEGILTVAEVAFAVDVPVQTGPPPDVAQATATDNAESADPQLLITLLLGFVGGIILNLMPCVFPVLGLKVLGFVRQAGEERRQVVTHGLVYTAGILCSFWALAGVLLVLRAGGAELGWGFQLQSSAFVFTLTVIMLVFALNLSGLFEVGLSLTGLGHSMTTRSGLAGSFFSGVLATVVATPCAAPFLAVALGASLSLPAHLSLLVFTAIGLGLASPYLLLSAFPSLVARLPSGGAWMESFKQGLAFLLYATVAGLVWVLAGQLDERQLLHVLLALVAIAFACWIYGRWSAYDRTPRVRWTARGIAAAIVGLSLSVGYTKPTPSAIVWEKWSPERVEELRAEGRPIYIDFTARWCATCQVNKRTVFGSDRVLRRFAERNVATLKADWTNQDPEITRALAAFGRSAVPFNLIYRPGEQAPVELPELLTPATVLDALEP